MIKRKLKVLKASSCQLVWHDALIDYVSIFQNKRFLPDILLKDVEAAQQFLDGNPILAAKGEGATYKVYGGLVSMMLLTNMKDDALKELKVLIVAADSVSDETARAVFAANLLASKIVGGNLKQARYKCPKRTTLLKMLSGRWATSSDDQLKNDLMACGLMEPEAHSSNELSMLDKIIQSVSTKT